MFAFLSFEQHLSQGLWRYLRTCDVKMTANPILVLPDCWLRSALALLWHWSDGDSYFQHESLFNHFHLHTLQIIIPKIIHNAKALKCNWLQYSNHFSSNEASQHCLDSHCVHYPAFPQWLSMLSEHTFLPWVIEVRSHLVAKLSPNFW